MLRLLAGARFQALFHSPPGVLFTFPSRYSCTVGRRVVLSLGGRSPLLPAGFLVPGGTPDCGPQARALAYGALTLCRAPSHASSAGHVLCDCGRAVRGPDAASSTPGRQRPHAFRAPRFGLAPVRSPLLGGSLFDFLSSGYLDVSVPPVASHYVWVAGPRLLGSPIRAPRDRSPCAAPPGLSRLAAPFVGSLRQGIRRAPFIPSGRLAPPASDHCCVLSRNLFLFALCGSQGALS